MTASDWIPRSEACKVLGEALGHGRPLSAYKVAQLVAARKLRQKRVGRLYYIHVASIKELLAA